MPVLCKASSVLAFLCKAAFGVFARVAAIMQTPIKEK
jgi:hypothetical protein